MILSDLHVFMIRMVYMICMIYMISRFDSRADCSDALLIEGLNYDDWFALTALAALTALTCQMGRRFESRWNIIFLYGEVILRNRCWYR